MHVVVNVTGGQGFLPKEVKDNAVLQQAFAQDIIDGTVVQNTSTLKLLNTTRYPHYCVG